MNTPVPRPLRVGRLLLGWLTGFTLCATRGAEAPSPTVRVRPVQSDELLANPGMGWQTFHRFADEDPNLAGLPSASAYFRFYRREIEPQEGQIAFARFDDLLAHARRAGQKLAFRIMCIGSGASMDVPTWLKEAGCNGVESAYGGRNHMDNFYLQQLEKTGAGEAWKQAPVAFETCWDMRKWKEAGWDIRFIFDYALGCHASYVNNKSAPIPDGTRPEIERLLRRLGYRLVIRSVEHEARVRPGGETTVAIQWENVGVAPPYRDDRVAVRLRPGDTSRESTIIVTDLSIRGWLPGMHPAKASLQVPSTLRPGRHELSVGVVDARDQRPVVRLAIAGRDPEGWYPVSHLEVVP